uniref:Rho GTPase activating protein at 5A, isoform A n=2 Tax=Drosophila melanogaster TaxID=7227 RepID=Q9W4A9_DROME|nr:Rho GTPase activating protein at 5A, isoform A [Drosophila melanogaster]AAF46047.1 Rho GTPase activating protein at 5A, isoform A [Drosophila melanogaster]|eukprot:NP_727007.1 Rho GTPase activating protein at 5A, isoform A [Drosophila melanogaster]
MPRNTEAGAGNANTGGSGGVGGAPEPSSPVQKVWKPELYKLQLEAPAPCPLRCQRTLPLPPAKSTAEAVEANNLAGRLYGSEYHGLMGHLEAEQLLANARDGSYFVRRSPQSDGYYTLSLRFNKRPKHYKLLYKPGVGHYLRGQDKRFDTVHDMVADGLINFHMQLHASPIIQQINQQTKNCYQQSPYMTLNGRKLRALSNELGKAAAKESKESPAEEKEQKQEEPPPPAVDPMPLVYEKPHHFKVHTFKGLNWCEFCANFLWGFTAQGVKCEACGFVAHSKCSELVPPKCVPDLKRIRGVFGTDLTTMVQLEPHHQIPFVVRRCVEEVEARGMLQEGIYRVSGFADEIEALKLALDREGEKTDMSETAYGNVNVIAGTLKLYLRLLPVPLITFQAYPSFMAAGRTGKQAEQRQLMAEAVRRLPPAHHSCLQYMLEHLKRVASHYAVNKMNEHNLATVFAPTLIATPQHMTNLTEEIFMLSSLITHCKTIFATS